MMNNYNMPEGNNESSNFNEAYLQINRLHVCWLNCKKYRVQGDLLNWRWELESIWSELSIDARRLNKTIPWASNETNITIQALDKVINACAIRGDAKTLYIFLDRKEKQLRLLQDKSGKGGSYDEDRSGMD